MILEVIFSRLTSADMGLVFLTFCDRWEIEQILAMSLHPKATRQCCFMPHAPNPWLHSFLRQKNHSQKNEEKII